MQCPLKCFRNKLTQDGVVASSAKLIVRLAFGIAMALHGLGKLPTATTWMGPEMPAIIQAAAAYAEFGSGLFLALGLLTPFASLSMMGVMIGALALVHVAMGHPYVSPTGGPSCELAVLYLVIALQFLLIGPGKFSVDYLIFKPKES